MQNNPTPPEALSGEIEEPLVDSVELLWLTYSMPEHVRDSLEKSLHKLLADYKTKWQAEAQQSLSISDRVSLLLAAVEINKLKADDYNWQVNTPEPVKQQLEAALAEIQHLTNPTQKQTKGSEG